MNTDSIGRRSFVRGSGIAALVAATGVAAGVAAAPLSIAPIDPALRAVAAHKRAWRALNDAAARVEGLDVIPKPRVQVGVLKRPDDDGPIWAYDQETVDHHMRDWERAFAGWRQSEARLASIRARLTAAGEDLRKQQRRYRRKASRIGLTAAQRAREAAHAAEDAALAVLVLTRPTTAEGAAKKRAYLNRRRWLVTDAGGGFHDQLIGLSLVVEG